MICHILNGDSLAHSFPATKIEGEIIVVREALIDGDLSGENLQEFWQTRAKHIGITEAEYFTTVVSEFDKIVHAPGNTEFNLWFEYDLFCQANMWFIIAMINGLSNRRNVYAVYTSHLDRSNKHFWNGFGPATTRELAICFADRILVDDDDLQLGQALWTAYKHGDLEELNRLANNQSPAFPYLQEVVEAHVDRFSKDGTKGRPETVVEDIVKNISTDFHEVFTEFWKRESIYGFGDLQLKKIYDRVMHNS